MLDDLKAKIAENFGKSTSMFWDQPVEKYTTDGFKVYWETLPIIAQYQY